jgi:hypothetical protein
MRFVLLGLLLNCQRGTAPVHNISTKPPPEPPAAEGRLLVTEDCTTAPVQPEVIRSGNLQQLAITGEVTFSFTGRGSTVFLVIARPGEPIEVKLGTGAVDFDGIPAHEIIERGEFSSVHIPQGGGSFEHYVLRITGCTVELLLDEGYDDGSRSEPSVQARYTIPPRTRVWAR